jgi:divalent metal cation (Fe/Co/Zn/Cd) transporter
MTTLGFVGLGHMGGSMVARFLAAGYTVYESILRLIDPRASPITWRRSPRPARWGSPATGWPRIRTRAGRRLDSPALIADSAHARADAYADEATAAFARAQEALDRYTAAVFERTQL